MSKNQKSIRPRPSDYDIEISDPDVAAALANLIEMGLVVDSGERRFQNGKWRIVWAAVTPDERQAAHCGRKILN